MSVEIKTSVNTSSHILWDWSFNVSEKALIHSNQTDEDGWEEGKQEQSETTRAAAVLRNTKTNTNMHTYTHVHTVYSPVSSTQIEMAFSFWSDV